MDMALLRNPPGADGLREALVQCVVSNDLPIPVLHDADESARAVVEQMHTWLTERQLDSSRIVNLGLSTDESGDGYQPAKLVEMMPSELAAWLIARFKKLGIPVKSLPTDAKVRQDIRKRFERLLLGHLWEGVSQQLEVTRLLNDLDRQLHISERMTGQSLDSQLKSLLEQDSCVESYTMVLDKVVAKFFEDIMREHGANVQELVQAHIARL